MDPSPRRRTGGTSGGEGASTSVDHIEGLDGWQASWCSPSAEQSATKPTRTQLCATSARRSDTNASMGARSRERAVAHRTLRRISAGCEMPSPAGTSHPCGRAERVHRHRLVLLRGARARPARRVRCPGAPRHLASSGNAPLDATCPSHHRGLAPSSVAARPSRLGPGSVATRPPRLAPGSVATRPSRLAPGSVATRPSRLGAAARTVFTTADDQCGCRVGSRRLLGGVSPTNDRC